MMGDGIAVDPTSQVLLAPFNGRIVQLHAAGHAASLESPEGVQVLMHIGIDTVKLKGQGFTPKVKIGDRVSAGQPLIAFDADLIAKSAKSLISVFVIVQPTKNSVHIQAGTSASAGLPLMKVEYQGVSAPTKPVMPVRMEKAESKAVEVTLPTGLHARPSALVANMAKRYQSRVELKKGSKVSDAKSVVGLLGLEIVNGDFVKFAAEGLDAKIAVNELADFLKKLKEQPEERAPMTAAAKRTSVDPNLILGVAASPGVAVGRIHRVQTERFEIVESTALTPAEEKWDPLESTCRHASLSIL